MLRIADVHAQFETCHLSRDGNGRVGRMLIALHLEHWGLLSSLLIYSSVYLKRKQTGDYDCLEANILFEIGERRWDRRYSHQAYLNLLR